MIHFAVVEDDAMYRDILVEYLHRFEAEKGEKFDISIFPDGKEIADNYKLNYDIILMDIEMSEMDGMTAAEKIRELDREVVIIFITNLSQYAIRGYEVEALDYVLKPISYYAFSQKISRAMTRMSHRRKETLSIPAGKGNVIQLEVSNLRFVEVIGHSIIYHTSRGKITSTGTISELESKLSPRQFFRCNKGYLVNLELVESVSGGMAIVGGEAVQISRAKKKAFLDALNDYISEVAK